MSDVGTATRKRSPRVLALGLIGCTLLLTTGDQFHVQFDILSYPGDGKLFGQAWWVAPLFVISTVGFVVLAWPFAPKATQPQTRDFATGMAWFFGTYVATAVFGEHVAPLTVTILTVWLIRVIGRADRMTVAAYSLLLALLGTLFESLINHQGLAHYEVSSFLLVPAWLPALYMQGAPMALAITRWLRFP
ncbi:MAG: hypothetical protein ABIR57_01265 [Aeromicrobium sp.]